jgi:hypothetical protein
MPDLVGPFPELDLLALFCVLVIAVQAQLDARGVFRE